MLSKDKTSFVLYTSFYDALQDLPLDRKGMLLDLIFKYEIYGDTDEFEKHFADLPNDVKMAFRFIKGQLDKDQERWREVCSKRAEAGKKSADVRWGKQSKTGVSLPEQNITKITNVKSVKTKITKITDNDNEYENDTHKCVCNNARDAHTGVCATHTRKIKQPKFFVHGKTDGECQAALAIMRKLDDDTLDDVATGAPLDTTLDGNPIWRTGSRELDMGAAYWVQQERAAAKETGGQA